MYMIENIKKLLNETNHKNISIKINNIRNKSDIVSGKVKNLYSRHFTFETIDGLIKSILYVDIITGNVELLDKKY